MVLILFCLFTVLCLVPLVRNFNFLSSYNIFLGVFCLYYCLALADYLRGDYTLRYMNDQVVVRYRENEVIFELILLNLFAAGMLLARLVIKERLTRQHLAGVAFSPPPYKNVVITSSLIMLVGLVMYALFIQLAYGGIGGMMHIDRYALYQKKKGMGSLLIGLYIFYVGSLMRLFYYVLYRKIVPQKFPFIAVIVTLLLLGIQYKNGDRSNMIFFLLPLCLLLLYKRPKFSLYLVVMLPVLMVGMQLMSVQRKLKTTQYKGSLISFVMQYPQAINIFQNGEFIAPTLVDRKIHENINMVHPRFGGTYVDVLLSFPPSYMVPKRPIQPGEWYASTFFPEEFATGQGFGFSVIAESILNFYYAGPLIYGFLLGLLFLYLDKRMKRTSSFYFFTIFCVLQYYIFLIPRSGIAGLIKPATTVILFSVVCIFVVSRLFKGRERQLQ